MAQLMWTLVGLGLVGAGLYWILQRFGVRGVLYAAPCLAVGLFKARFALDKVARRTVARIDARGSTLCALGFLSTTSWLLVLAMILGGRLLRGSPLPRADIGFLYVAAGTGLVVASRTLWRRWWTLRHPPSRDGAPDESAPSTRG
jgi:hypothetical protein